ncbi:transmembrane 220 family protein [Maribacter sp. X9]|uniref:transmembrane 220 family protein n=1 Tax=Maribacter sp. X9 TaxID=3402159 RepID=UPI003AF33AE0
MKRLFKVLGYLFFLLFTAGAAVQYNDPDALLWIGIYTLAALISLGFALNKIGATLPLVIGIISLIGFLYLYPSDFQGFDLNDGDIKTVELGREAFGLLIVSIIMFIFGFRLKRTL